MVPVRGDFGIASVVPIDDDRWHGADGAARTMCWWSRRRSDKNSWQGSTALGKRAVECHIQAGPVPLDKENWSSTPKDLQNHAL